MAYKTTKLKSSIKKFELIKEKTEKKSKAIGYIRLLSFFLTLIIGGIAFFNFSSLATQIILVLGLILFIVISMWQSNYIKYLKILCNWISIKKSFLARAELDWQNIEKSDFFNDDTLSNIEIDFNLTGEKSLTHLIDFTSSTDGANYLRDLLTNHKLEKSIIEDRQNLVKELISYNRFRERFLLILSQIKGKKRSPGNIKKWINDKSEIEKIKLFFLFLVPLAIVNITLIILQFLDILISAWIISSFIYVAIYYLSNKYYNNIGQVSELIKDELGKLSRVFEFINATEFEKYSHLQELCQPIQSEETSPIKLLNKIQRILNILSLRSNPFAWFFLVLLFPFDFYIAYKLEKYKFELKQNYEIWLDVFYQLEAFVSLATFGKLNYEYNFPVISDDKFVFEAERIGHPLIKKSEKIANNFSYTKNGNIVLITGSNMSGKSTFLRTLGINICLAYAGAPINACNFNISLLKVYSCIKVSDSVIDGISYFYSEVKRLKQLLDEYDENSKNPIIFFIDEIFKGTNNVERRIGSSAYIKSLVGKNGIGFVTTHDLDLVKLSDDNDEISNYHFKENIKNNKMEFDYTIHYGPCPTTNALQIMRIEGLPIDE